MKTKRFIASISAFAMIFGLSTNYISTDGATTFVYGDVDGDCIPQINDLTKMSLYLLQDITFNESQKKAADVNADGNVNIADLATMKQYVMHDNVEFGKSLSDVKNQNDFDILKCKIISESAISLLNYNLFTLDNRGQFSMVIDSENKFAELKQMFEENAKGTVEKIDSELDLSEDFFKENTLFVIARRESNGDIKAEISDIKLSKERGISFEITSDIPADNNSLGIRTWLHAVVIPNEYLKDIDKSEIRITNKGAVAENDGMLNYLNIAACDVFNYKISDYFDFLPADDKEFKSSAVIKSEEDFNNYNKKFNNTANKLSSYYGISEEFFKDNTLFIIPISENSGSIKDEITGITIHQDSPIYIDITSSVPATGECAMSTWHLSVAVPNKLIKNADTSDVKITRTVNRQKYIADDDVLDLTDCDTVDLPDPYYGDNSKYAGFHSSLITSTEELYKYNPWMKLITDLVRPKRDNYEDLLNDNVIVAIDDIGHSGTINKYISAISVDKNNNITVDFTSNTPSATLTADYRKTHICLLVPRKYLNKSSAKPTLEVIKHDIKTY